jgi:hypothetical protein
MHHIPLSLAIIFSIGVPALARPAGDQQVNVDGQRVNGRAGQVICRVQHETGSRLKSHRTCVTRQQWSDQRAQDKALVEKAQTNRVWPGG